MGVKKITSWEEFEKTIGTPVSLIDFSAPWCAPCRLQEPIMDHLAEQFRGKACIAAMNVDRSHELASHLGIRSVPTLILFKKGREIGRLVGLQPEETLSRLLEKHLRRRPS